MELTEAQKSEIREIFALFDKNSDGKVHTIELGTVLRAINLNPSEQEIEDLMSQIDPHKTGEFTLEQLISLVQRRGKDQDSLEDLVEALKVFDADRDGKITIEEFRNAMLNMGEKMKDHEIEEILNDGELVHDKFIHITDFAQLIMHRI